MASESWARSSLEREPAKNEPRVLADGADPSAFHIDIYLLSRCVTYSTYLDTGTPLSAALLLGARSHGAPASSRIARADGRRRRASGGRAEGAREVFSPTAGVLERALARGRSRPVATCARGFRRSMGLCEGADGQHCMFLASTSRKHLPHILQKLRYRGACAELASGEATAPR